MSLDDVFLLMREKLQLLIQIFLTVELDKNNKDVKHFKILVQNYVNLPNIALETRLYYLRCEAVKRATKVKEKFEGEGFDEEEP